MLPAFAVSGCYCTHTCVSQQPPHSDRRDPKLSTATKLFSSGGRSAVTRRSATKQAKRSSRCRGAFCTRRAHRLTTPRRLRSESPGPGSAVHPPRRWWRTPSLPPPPRRSAGCRRWDRELGSTLPPALCRSRPWRLRRSFIHSFASAESAVMRAVVSLVTPLARVRR